MHGLSQSGWIMLLLLPRLLPLIQIQSHYNNYLLPIGDPTHFIVHLFTLLLIYSWPCQLYMLNRIGLVCIICDTSYASVFYAKQICLALCKQMILLVVVCIYSLEDSHKTQHTFVPVFDNC